MSWYDPTTWSAGDATSIFNPALSVGGATLGGGKGGKGGGAPSTPDFMGLANRELQANRPTQRNAFGAETTWTTDANGNPVQSQTLGGPLGGAASSLEGQVATNAGQPLDTGSAARQKAIDATYAQEASRLDPQWAARENAAKTAAVNQGLDQTSDAYKNEFGGGTLDPTGTFNRARTDAYDTAMRNAISTGNEAQALTFGENLAARQAPLQELGQLRGFTSMPGFQPANFLSPAMAQYSGDLQKYGIQQQGKNSKMSGLGDLGSAGIMASAAKAVPAAAAAA